MAVPLEGLAEHERDEVADAMDVLSVSIAQARVVMFGLAILMMVAIASVEIFASRSVARPLAILDEAVQRVAGGSSITRSRTWALTRSATSLPCSRRCA
jgi:HAMP domain-containing protein